MKGYINLQKKLQELCNSLVDTGAGISPLDRLSIPVDEQVSETELKRRVELAGFEKILDLAIKVLVTDLICSLYNDSHFDFVASNHPSRAIGTNNRIARAVGNWSHKSTIQKYRSIIDRSAPPEILSELESLIVHYPDAIELLIARCE